MKFLFMYLSSSPCHILYILTKYIHQRLAIEFPPVLCSSYMTLRHYVSHPCETAVQIAHTFTYKGWIQSSGNTAVT